MPFTLTVRFEGLFTFVVRKNAAVPADNGLFALMPGNHPHPGHVVHEWSIEYGATTIKNLKGEMNLRDDPSNAWKHGKHDRIPNLLPYSRTTHELVDKALLGKSLNFPDATLHGRVVLPLHEDAIPFNKLVGVEWYDGANWIGIGKMTGVTKLTFNVTGASATIPGIPKITSAGEVTMKYVPNPNVGGTHKKHDSLKHAHQHGLIFKGKEQKFRIDEDYNGKSLLSVDPVNCTNAGGCPPEDLNCQNCPPTDPNCGEG